MFLHEKRNNENVATNDNDFSSLNNLLNPADSDLQSESFKQGFIILSGKGKEWD